MFDAVAGEKIGSAEGRDAWAKCIDTGAPDSKGPIAILDEELKRQTGDANGAGAVAILPTVRCADGAL